MTMFRANFSFPGGQIADGLDASDGWSTSILNRVQYKNNQELVECACVCACVGFHHERSLQLLLQTKHFISSRSSSVHVQLRAMGCSTSPGARPVAYAQTKF